MSSTNPDARRGSPAKGLWLVTSPVEPVRRFPSHESEMLTQVLGGMVLSCRTRGDWVRATVPGGLMGWIRSWGVRKLERDSPWLREQGVTVAVPWAGASTGSATVWIPAGVRCLAAKNRGRAVTVRMPWGNEGTVPRSSLIPADALVVTGIYGRPAAPPTERGPDASTLRRIARRATGYLGVPYLWGGLSSGGMDCSGLIWLAAALEGVLFPRDAKDQCAWLREVAPGRIPTHTEGLSPKLGEIVFFGPHIDRADHVGIGSGGGRFLHASRRVRISSLRPERNDFEATLRQRVVWITTLC